MPTEALDVDRFRAAATGLLTSHRITLPRGRTPDSFRGLVQMARVGDIGVIHLRQGVDVDVEILEPIDYYDVMLAVSGSSTIEAAGTRSGRTLIDPSHAALLSPGMSASMRMDSDYGQLHLRIERQTVDRVLEAMLGRPAGDPVLFDVALDLTSGGGRSWRHLAAMVFEDMTSGDGLTAHPLAARSWQDALLSGLLAAQPGSHATALDDRVRGRPHRRQLSRVLDFCEERVADPIGVVDMAEVAGISTRALQRMFREELGSTPTAHLQGLRLSRVRSDLLEGASETVTDVALRWGFTHLSRFAAAYRARYGESPSQTRRGGSV
ncbi:AraC family transcriptional regulator [Gordonia sihwensis]|uniref:AraC family transcriptional regulator n=1 Tax=Gordonia sihwensis TaxID=173559 RepID=UPI0005EEFC1B|nr:AraC family transcriptional regulator [Gordonia sihwensis]